MIFLHQEKKYINQRSKLTVSFVVFQKQITECLLVSPLGGRGMFQDPASMKPYAVSFRIDS